MERKTLKMTPNRRFYFDHFAPPEQEKLIGMLLQYEADGVVPEINDSMMHMAFGAMAKSIDAAKKRAATKAAKQQAAAAQTADEAQQTGLAAQTDAEPQQTPAAQAPPAAKAAPALKKRSTKELPPPVFHPRGADFLSDEAEKQRIIEDFLWFYGEFPFKNNKMSPEKALDLWLDEEMDTEPIEYVMKALRRDISCKVFKTHAPDMRKWILRENWAPLIEKAEKQAAAA
ncbi:MAG: DUF6291 domain-containing protein [Oscillospiraceae bacterium]|jgi:hypothetical protein|nr:DUF6291 domain-containing protein [Oscillospiraceae bacterium]